MIIDVKQRRPVDRMPSGLRGFISYGRLVEKLRYAGELKPYETITHLDMTSDGISYAIEDRRITDQ